MNGELAALERRLKEYLLSRPDGKMGEDDVLVCLEHIRPEVTQKYLANLTMLGPISSYTDHKDAIQNTSFYDRR